MANHERGEVSIPFKDRTLTLRPTLNALCTAEERSGKTTAELFTQASIGNMNATRMLLWSYLQKYHAKEFDTVEKVGDMIDDVGLDVVNEQLNKLQTLNAPAPDSLALAGVSSDRPPEAQAGAGAH